MERGNSGRRLLVWDAPNMDMCLSEVIGERASSTTRPNLGAVNEWMHARSDPGDTVESCVFCNVPPGFESAMGHWVVSLRHAGFAVFVKPKRRRNDDVDAEMLRHIDRRFTQGSLVGLVVASHDAKAFAQPLHRYAEAGVHVEVLGYREKDRFAAGDALIEFVDVEDLPGVFARPLPRTNLFGLPAAGRWFEPFPPPTAGVQPTPTSSALSISAPARDDQPPGPEAATTAADTTETRQPPGRGEVLALVEAEVVAAVASGRGGLGLREVGDLLRLRFPDFALDELGFASVGDLVDAVAEPRRLIVVRRAGGHLVTVAGGAGGVPPSDAAAAPAPRRGAGSWPESGGPGTDAPIEAAAPALGGPDESHDAGDGDPDRGAPGRDAGGAGVEQAGSGNGHDPGDAAGAGDDERGDGQASPAPGSGAPPSRLSLVHPIYRAFGVDRTA